MSLVEWPTEAEARGFADLNALWAWCRVQAPVQNAVTRRVGALGNSIGALPALPASVLYRVSSVARVITQAFVAAVAAQGTLGAVDYVAPVAEVPEQSRALTPSEVSQVGTSWRIARRIIHTRNGKSWDESEAADVDPMAPPPAAAAPPVAVAAAGVPPPVAPPTPVKHKV